MRLNKLDEIRGVTLVSMILYHFLWDLVFIAGINIPWYSKAPGNIWQKSICITFIFLSGFCFSFGSKRFKRSLQIFICGAIVTAVTLIAMPDDPVVFGVLTFIGSAGLITIPFDKLHRKLEKNMDKTKVSFNASLLMASFILFIMCYRVNRGYLNLLFTELYLPADLYAGYVSTFFGFMMKGFVSSDYFSILPWYFLYLCGYFLYRISGIEEAKAAGNTNRLIDEFKDGKIKALQWLGRHSLLLYMLHQPVLYMITLLIVKIK